jgi:DNA ligase-1
MNEDDMMHGGNWQGENLRGWRLSEKFDGIRAFWDGARLWSRGGNIITLPDALRLELPAVPLDGELWAGHGQFERARVACRFGRIDDSIRFWIFDAPVPGAWHERIAAARGAIDGSTFAAAVQSVECTGNAHAMDVLQDVQGFGGEGLVARHPGNLYAPGRTCKILKLKSALAFA